MKFTPRSEDTRQFIIESTAEIFNTKGYAGTSMTDLTEATQLTKGSIYGNFENKEEVALAVLDYMIAIRTRAIREQLDKATTYKDKLLVYPTVYSSSRSQVFPKGGCPLLNMGTEADDTHEGLRKKVAEAFAQWKKQIETIIADGIAAKEFRADTNAEETALRIIATIEGSTLLSRIMRKPGYHDILLNGVKELIEKISLT